MAIYGLNFSNRRLQREQENGDTTESVLIGLTTCMAAPNNRVMVLEMNEDNLSIVKLCETEEYYPCTKI